MASVRLFVQRRSRTFAGSNFRLRGNIQKEMNKRVKTFSSILHTNTRYLSRFYYKYMFTIVIVVNAVLIVCLYRAGVHTALFGDTPNALGEYAKAMGGLLGIELVFLGLWINNRRISEMVRQNNIAEKSQINTRFKDAATLLGNENVSTVLSGVYALHQIALDASVDKDKKSYVSIVHDILCTYIKENTDNIKDEKTGKLWRINKGSTFVIQTIMKVLFKNEGYIYSNFVTDLSKCILEDIDLEEAHLANVDFSKAKFIRTSFKHATIRSCYLESTFIDEVNFEDCTISKVVFDNSHIRNSSFKKSCIEHSDFWHTLCTSVNFKDTRFIDVDFKEAIFEGDVHFEGSSLAASSIDEIKSKSKELTNAANEIKG